MKKFDGILICTDFDSSVAWRTEIPEKNARAIKYFKENGGLFTVITGRSRDVLRFFGEDSAPNTFIGAYNGTMVYDPEKDVAVTQEFHLYPMRDKVMTMKERYAPFRLHVSAEFNWTALDSADEDFEKKFDECTASERIRKYYFLRPVPFTDEDFAEIRELFAPDHEVSRSSEKGIEVQRAGFNKGSAARKIKELTGSRLLVCVGDYDNDASMVEAADIGYAVENSVESLKQIADRVTIHCKDGAIAAIIEELERELDK